MPGSGGRWVRIVPGYRRAGATRGALRRVPIEHDGQRFGAITLVAGEDDELFSPAVDRLLSAVAETGAARVLATHGFAGVFARYLRERGLDAGVIATRYGDEEEGSGPSAEEEAP